MLIFLDTEFTDFHQPQLISLGMVSECGRFEFYAEHSDFELAKCSEFIHEVVLPKLGEQRLDRATFARDLQQWFEKLHSVDGWVIVLYDFDTDFDLLKQALGTVPGWLEGHNIGNEISSISCLRDDDAEAHHALHDARMLRLDWLASRGGLD